MNLRELLLEKIERTGKGDTAIIGWGRGMGHKGHMYLASSVITHAKEVGGDPYFVVSRTVGKDDPITPEEKLAIYKKVFPEQGHIFQTATDELPDLTRVLTNLNQQGYRNAVVIVGADNLKAFQYLNNYNGKPNKAGEIPFSFDDLQVISRQMTNDPSKEQEGPRATPMRQVLMDPSKSEQEQFAVWRDAMNPEISDDEVRDLMNKAKERMTAMQPAPKKAPVKKKMPDSAVAEGMWDTIKGTAKDLTRDKTQKIIKRAWDVTYWPKHIKPSLSGLINMLGEPEIIENDRSSRAILKQYTVDIVFPPIDPAAWKQNDAHGDPYDVMGRLERILKQIEKQPWNKDRLVLFDDPILTFKYSKNRNQNLVIPVRLTSFDSNVANIREQGAAEGLYDQGERDFRGDPIKMSPIARKAISMLKRATVQDRMTAADITNRRDFEDFIKYARKTGNLKDTDVDEASYKGNIGIMELIKFFSQAKEQPELVRHVKELIADGKDKEVWHIVQKHTGTKLVGKEFAESISESIKREASRLRNL